MRVIGVKLLGSWPTLLGTPDFGLPEIALIGRSNVGKSTLVNTLVGRKALARVSSTPGKTQDANLFEVELEELVDSEHQVTSRKKIILVDLPGFGFAKVNKDKSKDFRKLIVDYISKRKSLNAICLLNDCRRAPGEDELLIWEAARHRELRCALVITKIDKLGSNAARESQKQISELYDNPSFVIVSGTKISKEKIQEVIFRVIN